MYAGRNLKRAQQLQNEFEERRRQLKYGLITPPERVTLRDFLLEGLLEPSESSGNDGFTIGPPPRMTLRALVTEYLEVTKPPMKAASTIKTETYHLGHLLRFLKQRRVNPRLDAVNVKFFDQYKTWRLDSVKPRTVNMELRTFQLVFKMAVKYGYVVANAVADVERFKETQEKPRFMTKTEIERELRRRNLTDEEKVEIQKTRFLMPMEVGDLLDLAEGSWVHVPVALAVFTGMRRGELLRLSWADVDFKAGLVTARSRKQSRARVMTSRPIPMHHKLKPVLKRWRSEGGSEKTVVVGDAGAPVNEDTLHRAFKKLVGDTDLEGIGWHTLRHSFATNLAADNVDQRLINRWMGHTTDEMARRYQHVRPDKSRQAINNLQY